MKKRWSVLTVLALILMLSSCVRQPADPSPAEEGRTVGYHAQYVHTNRYSENGEYPRVVVLRSAEELAAHTQGEQGINALSANSDYIEACRSYNETYFNEHILVFVELEEPSGSIRHKVTGVSLKEDELIIEIDRLVPETGTDDMAVWYIMVEPEAGVDIADAESVTVFIDGENATDPYVPSAYTSGYAHMELAIPESWERELVEDTGSSFGIRFWPQGQSEGKLYVSYQPEGFGVCGTGLKTKEITLGTHKASQGTYDNKKVWDYIWLKDTAGDYVIYNEGADIWWDQYGKEAMAILDTLSVGKDCIPKEEALKIAQKECTLDYQAVSEHFLHHQGAWMFTFHDRSYIEKQEITVDSSGKTVAFLYHQAP